MMKSVDLLFTLLRLSLYHNNDDVNYNSSIFIDAGDKEWEQVFDLSVKQGVLLLSYGGLQLLSTELHPPRKLKLRWTANVAKGSERYRHYKHILNKLSEILLVNDMNLVLIKGSTLSELYPIPSYRESGDIDIYVQEKAKLANEILSPFAIKKGEDIPKHSTFFMEGVPIENHYTFFDVTLRFQRESLLYQKMEDILRSMLLKDSYTSISFENVSQLHPQIAALYFIGHTFRHFCCLDMNIRHMCDWTVFFSKRKQDINCELLSLQIDDLGLSEFVCHINGFCSNRLGFKPYFKIPQKEDVHAERFILKTIMQYKSKIHIPVYDVLRYLFYRNNIYNRYLGKVKISEFLLPEIKSYFAYIIKQRWRSSR